MKDISTIIKPNILSMNPYSSARDEYTGHDGVFLDANENPHPFDYARYPDPYQQDLKNRISAIRKVAVKNIFLGNGSDEIIDLLIRCTCQAGDRILTLDPSYGMYKVSAAINDITIDLAPLDTQFTVKEKQFFQKLNAHHKLIFICSPNNPNGGIVSKTFVEKLLQQASGLVVIDEAYIDFSDESGFLPWIDKYKNLVVLQTFSKSWAAAGLRIGMAFTAEWLVAILNKVKPPYNISAPTQQLALERLNDMSKLEASITAIKLEREVLKIALSKLPVVEKIFPSEANFLLVRFQDADSVMAYLLEQKIIVRNRSTQHNCQNTLRISVGTKQENLLLINKLKEYNNG